MPMHDVLLYVISEKCEYMWSHVLISYVFLSLVNDISDNLIYTVILCNLATVSKL